MSQRPQNDGSGCAALFVVVFILGAVVAAAVSLAAVVDPFSWMPSLGEVWADCDDDYGTDVDECALSERFDGFWWHTVANLAYTLTTAVCLHAFALAVADFRRASRERFADSAASQRYADATDQLVGAAAVVGILAAIPMVVVLL